LLLACINIIILEPNEFTISFGCWSEPIEPKELVAQHTNLNNHQPNQVNISSTYSLEHNTHNELITIHLLGILNTMNPVNYLIFIYLSWRLSQPYFERVWGWDSHSQNKDLGVLRDSQNFIDRLHGSKHLTLGCYLFHWKAIEV